MINPLDKLPKYSPIGNNSYGVPIGGVGIIATVEDDLGDTLPGASVALYKNGLLQDGGTTNNSGEVRKIFEDLKTGGFEIRISFVGYKTIVLENQILLPSKYLDIGTFSMYEESTELNEVTVVSIPIKGLVIDDANPSEPLGGVKLSSTKPLLDPKGYVSKDYYIGTVLIDESGEGELIDEETGEPVANPEIKRPPQGKVNCFPSYTNDKTKKQSFILVYDPTTGKSSTKQTPIDDQILVSDKGVFNIIFNKKGYIPEMVKPWKKKSIKTTSLSNEQVKQYLQEQKLPNVDLNNQKTWPARLNLNQLKRDFGVVKLKKFEDLLKGEVDKFAQLPEAQIKALIAQKEDVNVMFQKALNKAIHHLKTVVLPAVIMQLAAFGIAKAQEAANKKYNELTNSCPSNMDELNKIIKKKNQLVKSLNNMYTFLDSISKAVGFIDGLLSAIQIALQALSISSLLPIPSVPGVPTLPPGIANKIEGISDKVKKFKNISSSTFVILSILRTTLGTILEYLNIVDTLIQGCAQEMTASGTTQLEENLQISKELTALTRQQSNQLSPVVTNINGFEMGVETEENTTNLKRRRAIARNKQGVVMLKGEWSFSSIDQILIDELVYYIEQNDLKAI